MTTTKNTNYNWFILIFVGLKVILNLFAMPHFGFHRDELLHLVLAEHLDWGYKEVPPFIALLAYITVHVFGNSVFAARIFATLFGGLIVWLSGLIVVELGGRKFAIALTCIALIFAPAFAASEYLFQPVVFDQFWWVLAAWLLLRYVNTQQVSYLYWLGAAIGFGMLTKYTMAFFTFALLIALLISNQRRLLFNKHVAGAALLAFVIFLPNVIWQYVHHFPFITHMRQLKEKQLQYNHSADFVVQQFLVNGIALFVWLAGFGCLIFSPRLRKYRFLSLAYVLIFLFLLKMNGKHYYLFGAYPMLFAAGGFAFEQLLKSAGNIARTAIILLFAAPNLLLFPAVLPLLSINQTLAWFRLLRPIHAFNFAVTWEDHQKHATTQDYADMFGWDEMAKKAAGAYHALTPSQQKQTVIFGGNYGQAGALHHYAKQYGMPDVVSLNSSFALWAPDSLRMKYFIYVDRHADELAPFFGWGKKIGEVENPLAVEKGTGIYLYVDPKPGIFIRYDKELAKKRLE
jgi:MFS family permease